MPTDPDYDNEQMMRLNPGYWASQWGIKLQAGPFTFKGFEYQVEPMSYTGKRLCYLKARQSFGATIDEVLKDLHGMIMRKYKLGVAHIFPTNDEVNAFSKSIFKPLIAANKASIGKFVRNVSGGTDTTSLKNVNGAMLFLLGARLSQTIGDSTETTSSKTAGFSCDKVVFDESDYMEIEAITRYIQSMGMSPHQHEVYLGNPSHEDFGIDLIFKQSDQRYWFRKCSCGHWTCAEKSFPECIKIRPDGTGYIGCDKCGKEVKVWNGDGTGEWVPDFPDKTKYMQGYMASQMMTPYNDPADILEDFATTQDLATFYRLRLGRPYSAASDKLRKHTVLACCGNDSQATRHSGPCAMGVDVGKAYHAVVIGIKTSKEQYEIIKTAKAKDFQEVFDLARRYNVKSDVVDIGPYYEAARKYQKNSGHKTFLCDYKDTQVTDAMFNDNTGVVKVNKTEVFDLSHRLLMNGDIRLPARCPEIEEFARQCCNCARFEEKDKRSGGKILRYRPTGDKEEHFRSALNYFLLAASGHRIATVSRYKKKRQLVANNTG